MSKKTAELSANLVAIKGTAVPAPDMPGRVVAEPLTALVEPSPADSSSRREELTPLNFRIPASFRREFKTYAATHDLKLNELLRRCFEAYRDSREINK